MDRRPEVRAPVLVCAFKGWNDAAESATTALALVAAQTGAERFGAIDPDPFMDFQMTRPMVRLRDGRTRDIVWPEAVLSVARTEPAPHDLVLISGTEPNYRWRGFCEAILALVDDLGVELVVTLGALLAEVPHTRPVTLTGIASTPELIDQLGFSTANYEGPTGIVGVLHDACAKRGVPSASLWAPVPHYVAGVPSPKATLALLRGLEGLIDMSLDASDLEEAAAEYEQRLDEAVASEPDVRTLVERLESEMEEDLPSGDTIAQEFERFLRRRRPDEN